MDGMFEIKVTSVIFAADGLGLVLSYYVQIGAKTVKEMLLASGLLIGFVFAVVADIFKIIGPHFLIFAHPWDEVITRFALIGGLAVTLWWEKHRNKITK